MKLKYGMSWKDDVDDAEIERYCIRQGGEWTNEKGEKFGNGLMFHFKQYWSLLWPADSQTWWTDLIMKEIFQNQFTSIVGPASSWKTGTVSRLALMDWSCFPDCTTVIMSSTDMAGLRARVYGETTRMWQSARERHEWFPGHPVDSKCVITYRDVEEEKARDLRDSIVGVPCVSSTGKFLGMGKYSGRKNRRVWCVSDEYQFCQLSVLDAQNNLVSNGPNLVAGIIRDKKDLEFGKPLRGYKCVFIGNTNPTVPNNPLDMVSEPENGFSSIPEDGKTKVWDCKKLPNHPVKCRCVNMDAMDSPNNAYPIDKPQWPHLAGKHKLAIYTEGSESYWSQGRGVFKFGLAAFKVITKELCEQFHALDPVAWKGTSPTTKIGMCDASYTSTGDRCCLGSLEFGECVDGRIRILLHPFFVVPITVRQDMIPEDQIAIFCKDKMEARGVPPENFFFDGRGSLAMSYARIWSPNVNSLEFGGVPTDRPAGPDLYTLTDGIRTIKTARQHFSKFVTELWWSWRYVVESDQMRGLTLDVILDAAPREWYTINNNRIEIEPKSETRKRTGVSPDLADMVVTGVEGARRRGFKIEKLAVIKDGSDPLKWLSDRAKSTRKWLASKQLASK